MTTGPDPYAFSDGPPGDLEMRRLVQRAQAALAWRVSVDALRGHGRSERGVEVVVAASGGVVQVHVPDEACRDGGPAVTEQVLDAVAAAQADLAVQLRRSSADTFGDGSSAARTVATATESRFRRAQVLPEDPDATP